jgi:protein gp37
VFPSLCDPFEDRPELIGPREQLFGLIDRTPNLIWLLLTKRPENIRPLLDHELMPSRYWPGAAHKTTWDDLVEGNIPNLWLGVSCEDQRRAEERIPHLLATPAAVRFLSVEPLLEAVDLTPWMTWHPSRCPLRSNCDWAGPSCPQCGYEPNYIDWVICGGESGPGARPMHPDWARSIRDQCIAAGVAFHFKQWGEWAPVGDDTPRGAKLVYVHRRGGYTPTISGYEPGCPCDSLPSDEPMARVGKHAAGRLLDGREWNEFPEAHAHA